jgi:sigma-B regulation protein RsbU (phosphoserine phosphatase)
MPQPAEPYFAFFDMSSATPWERRLEFVVETMREISRQTDPQSMVQAYGRRMRQVMPSDRSLSLSRRDLQPPDYRITRSSLWETSLNPWRQRDRLPLFAGGLLSELLYGDQPVVVNDLPSRLTRDEPAREFLEGMGSLVFFPQFDKGTALNGVVLMRQATDALRPEMLPQHVWVANLFGRATNNLVLSEELKRAYDAVDREMQVVADIQRSLLPSQLPDIPTLELAAHYQTSRRAGGDYYDFFPLPDGRWGVLLADVSGHGTPAAVLMAITHSIAHTLTGPPAPPSRLLRFINDHLAARYTTDTGTFVTAFYGIYDPATRVLTYASAGHNPPRVGRCDGRTVRAIDRNGSLPLGIEPHVCYEDTTEHLASGDYLLLYTDGITEARSPAGELFGIERLDAVVADCTGGAMELVEIILRAVAAFTRGRAPTDDRTLLVARVT